MTIFVLILDVQMSVLVAQQDEAIDQIQNVAATVEADTRAGYVVPGSSSRV